MRTIIAGSRRLCSAGLVAEAVRRSGFVPSVVLCGCAPGLDQAGRAWAESRGIPVEFFPARWTEFGRSAGPRRNRLMVEEADALVAVWDGLSFGTADCIAAARRAGLRVFVLQVCPEGQLQLSL